MFCGMKLSLFVHETRYISREVVSNTAVSCALPWFPLSWRLLESPAVVGIGKEEQ